MAGKDLLEEVSVIDAAVAVETEFARWRMAVTHRYYIKRWWPGETHPRWQEHCIVLCRGRGPGPRNLLVQFADGEIMVTIRFGIRREQHPSPL
jgi:hypothetical protein